MNEKGAKLVACPSCKKKGGWFAGKYGPFCSKRCKLIDLGKWLGGEHVISEPLRPEHFRAADEDNIGSLDGSLN
ncbi:MAG TPA: DNA gyrase inhibitor YacG [Verrucomicrobiae bacterium]|nr:DNA gyrase inhibitor YacG [Verrucomicrobiae bacterium]